MLGGGMRAARYYLERSADCRTAAYYTGRSEPEGRWRGEGATALGLEGRVTGDAEAAFAGLLDGRLPDGTVASRPVWRASPQHGKPDVRVDVRRSGLDLTVSAPKSVSVLYGLAEPAVAAAVLRAHERAVDEAVGYLERHASHGLRGHQGGQSRAAHITTDGLVAAAFTHRASRAGDPQLHTHLVVTNVLHGSDGQWSAVDSRAIHRHARTAGCVYQACLRGGLSAELSIGWGWSARVSRRSIASPAHCWKFSPPAAIRSPPSSNAPVGMEGGRRSAPRTAPARPKRTPQRFHCGNGGPVALGQPVTILSRFWTRCFGAGNRRRARRPSG